MPQPTTPRGALLAYADHLDAAPPSATWLPPASIAKLIREHAELYPATPDPADGPGGHWTPTEWSEWSNELAMLVPEDCPWSNPEGAQEGIILDHFTRLADLDATRRSLAAVVGAETLDWRAHHVDPGTKDPEDGTEIPAGWYVLATDPDEDPENGHPIVMQVSAVHGGAELDAGEDRSRVVAEALVRLLAAAGVTR